MFFPIFWFLTLTIITSSFVSGVFQGASIEFLPDVGSNGGAPQSEGIKLTQSNPSVTSFVRGSKKVCVQGSWVLYNKPNYGQNDIGSPDLVATTVYSTELNPDCDYSKEARSILKNTHSARALVAITLQGTMPEVEIYRYKNFIVASDSEIWRDPNLPTATDLAAQPYESFVVTSNSAPLPPANWYIVCGQDANCICVNDKNTPLIVRDTSQFPTAKPLNRLTRFQWAGTATLIRECGYYPSPLE